MESYMPDLPEKLSTDLASQIRELREELKGYRELEGRVAALEDESSEKRDEQLKKQAVEEYMQGRREAMAKYKVPLVIALVLSVASGLWFGIRWVARVVIDSMLVGAGG